jgi:hypothetical protein
VALYYHLGKLYERIGNNENAKATYATGMEQAKKAGDFKTAGELHEALSLLTE